MTDELLQLQAQVNALSRAWLYLAVNAEMHGGLNAQEFEAALLGTRWPDSQIDAEGRKTMAWLVDELQRARELRQSSGQL